MSTIALDRHATRARRTALRTLVGAGRARAATALLLLDTVAAIGFAGGLALAIAATAGGGSALPGVLLALLCGLARAGFAALAAVRGAAGGRELKRMVRSRVVQGLLAAPTGGARAAGELVAVAVDEVDALEGHVARFLPAKRAAALAPLLVLAATAIASPVAAAILGGTLLPFVLALALAGGAAADESRRQFAALGRLSGLLGDRVRAMPLVLAFGAEDREAARLGAAAEEVARRTLRVLRVAFLSTGALEFFAALSVALVAVYGGFNLLGLLPFEVPERLTLAEGLFVLALAPEFYGPMRRLAAAYHDRQAAETAAERLGALTVPPARGAPARAALPQCPPAVTFDRVSIRYPDSDRDALSGFSLRIGAGETVALMGPSGSGKTSLLHLLLGLAPLRSGAVLVDGRALDLRTGVAAFAAWAGQSPLILPGTIAENIALAYPGCGDGAVLRAAAAAGLAPALARRAEGIRSALDPRGSGLSGGERRRIGLARALLKPAPLLLFDEPTAHLDPGAEAELVDVIRAASRGRTTLIATHSARLAAIADRVVRLEDC